MLVLLVDVQVVVVRALVFRLSGLQLEQHFLRDPEEREAEVGV